MTEDVIEEQLTLRDQFAMSALTGMMANGVGNYNESFKNLAALAYQVADLMLETRKGEKP